MPSSLSYLQTLPQTEATALVTSLQKVKEHLSQELAWINTQLQQKTVQLQGIDSILADLGSPAPESPAPAAEEPINGNTSVSRLLDLERPTSPQASPSSDHETVDDEAVDDETVDAPELARSQRGKQPTSRPKVPAKSKRGVAKPASQAKSPASATQPNTLSSFLQSALQNQPLSDSIAQVLSNAVAPLSTDNLMVELYEGLSNEDYQRAKRSLTNILSTGRSKGKWRSTERGLYSSNAV